jgi:hypothetical protein
MEQAHARRPSADGEAGRDAPSALRPPPEPSGYRDAARPRRQRGPDQRRHRVRPPAYARPDPDRPTVRITGQAVAARPKRRPRSARAVGAKPERLALWAVVLGLFLALVAATSARGDVEPASGATSPAAGVSR